MLTSASMTNIRNRRLSATETAARKHPNRAAAAAANQPRYSVGSPCERGHEDSRYTKTGRCVECERERVAKWRDKKAGRRRPREIPVTVEAEDIASMTATQLGKDITISIRLK